MQAPLPAGEHPLDAYSRVVTAVAERLTASVASLRVRSRARQRGAGSAVAVTPDGFLLTSAHVVQQVMGGSATFADGRELDFEVAGSDPFSDLAVIRVQGDDLAAATLGDADSLLVGELVVAIGNPLGFAGSVSAGVVSALGRSLAAQNDRHARVVENVIQTDASLHPGNSGGALANGAAQVVGINTAVVGPWVGQGLGLAVPINVTTRRIVGALMSEGRVRRAFLGVAGGPRPLPPRAADLLERRQGMEVVQVVEGGPAQRAGLRPEDIILELDGTPVEDGGDLQRLMGAEVIGRPVALTVLRGGDPLTVTAFPVELD
ncbi:MAG: trypsin-like peptidase domain-containing protein [Actinomycetota bacterium]|nr:trypsin-like peptidase domain-containing protein [Actinomycetota bacterium]